MVLPSSIGIFHFISILRVIFVVQLYTIECCWSLLVFDRNQIIKYVAKNKIKHFLFQITIARHCGLGGEYIRRNHTYSALSRCNGMGSFKLTAAVANQQRSPYSNIYNHEQKRLSDIRSLGNGAIDINIGGEDINDKNNDENSPVPINPDDANNDLNNRDDDRFRQRFVSVSSQSTLFTTISRVDGNSIIAKAGDCGINNNVDLENHEKNKDADRKAQRMKSTLNGNDKKANNKSQSSGQQSQSTLGTIAEKLRKKVLLFKSVSSSSQGTSNNTNDNNEQVVGAKERREERKLEKGSSVDSAHTNTISNSSLQEVDDDEFESTELAKYMGQINNEIR